MPAEQDRIDRIVQMIPTLLTLMGELHASGKGNIDITFNQYQVLRILDQKGELSVNDIAKLMRMGQSATSQLLDRMVKAELVHREIDPEDRRRMIISLNKKGHRVMDARTEFMRESYKRLFQRLDEDDQKRFEEAFQSFSHIATKLQRHPG